MVKDGIMSVTGSNSYIKETKPATFPTVPLYIQTIIKNDSGAQTTSVNSPITGKEKDNIPMPSNKILKKK